MRATPPLSSPEISRSSRISVAWVLVLNGPRSASPGPPLARPGDEQRSLPSPTPTPGSSSAAKAIFNMPDTHTLAPIERLGQELIPKVRGL